MPQKRSTRLSSGAFSSALYGNRHFQKTDNYPDSERTTADNKASTTFPLMLIFLNILIFCVMRSEMLQLMSVISIFASHFTF